MTHSHRTMQCTMHSIQYTLWEVGVEGGGEVEPNPACFLLSARAYTFKAHLEEGPDPIRADPLVALGPNPAYPSIRLDEHMHAGRTRRLLLRRRIDKQPLTSGHEVKRNEHRQPLPSVHRPALPINIPIISPARAQLALPLPALARRDRALNPRQVGLLDIGVVALPPHDLGVWDLQVRKRAARG